MTAILEANRQKRDQEAKARQEALRALYEQQRAKALKDQEYVLVKIAKQKAAEREQIEKEKEAAFQEAMNRLNGLSFAFTFSQSEA